jgi:hypothetical protein
VSHRLLRWLLAAVLLAVAAPVVAQVAPPPPTPVEIGRAKDVLDQVLARTEFRQQATESTIKRLQRKAALWLADLWQRLGIGRVVGGSTTRAIAWIVALAALAGLVAWMFRALTRANRDPRFALTAPPSTRKTARSWALAAAAAGDLREVVRCAYNATVTRLYEEGVWKPDPARTPREHVRLLTADHRRRPAVVDVARRFEEVWFAARTPTDDDRAALLARLKELGCLPID